MNFIKNTLIVAGGGSGGHVWPGIAIADEWMKVNPEGRVLYVGAHGGIEEKLVPKSGYPMELLRIGSLKRVSLVRRLKTAIQLPFSLLHSLWILIRERPQAVIGVGGYASGPIVLLAGTFGRLFGTRTGIVEPNAAAGFTNRVLGKVVGWIYANYEDSRRIFTPDKVVVTGYPIRQQFKPLESARRQPLVIFAFGGSQGALGMNTMIIEALPHLKGQGVEWVHQTGEIDYERVKEAHEKNQTGARVEKFIYEMEEMYQKASLIICRAGASTLSELAAVKRASILVPLPTASDNHQYKNAMVLVGKQAAILAEQGKTSGADLAQTIVKLLQNPLKIDEMERNVGQFYRPNSARDVVNGLGS